MLSCRQWPPASSTSHQICPRGTGLDSVEQNTSKQVYISTPRRAPRCTHRCTHRHTHTHTHTQTHARTHERTRTVQITRHTGSKPAVSIASFPNEFPRCPPPHRYDVWVQACILRICYGNQMTQVSCQFCTFISVMYSLASSVDIIVIRIFWEQENEEYVRQMDRIIYKHTIYPLPLPSAIAMSTWCGCW